MMIGFIGGVSKLIHTLSFAQSPDFLKPGLCYFLKFCTFRDTKKLIMAKVHFRSYIHKKMILFPQRIDKDIAEDALQAVFSQL